MPTARTVHCHYTTSTPRALCCQQCLHPGLSEWTAWVERSKHLQKQKDGEGHLGNSRKKRQTKNTRNRKKTIAL
ncbi:hypothetical protein ACOMHN_008747 [Nucella lapillus]